MTGDRGELFTTAILMTGDIFYAVLIGGNHPTYDIYAEINDDDTPYPLLIQVKTTEKAYRYNLVRKKSIKTSVPENTIDELAAKPIPTYVAGYDMVDHILYIAPVFSGNEEYPSIPINHKIELKNPTNATVELTKLKDDVVNFFKNKTQDIQGYKRTYTSLL